MNTTKAIENTGWGLERMIISKDITCPPELYRASQGGFKTLWRHTPEQVLEDLKKIREAREKSKALPF